jgi:hypothetical protein
VHDRREDPPREGQRVGVVEADFALPRGLLPGVMLEDSPAPQTITNSIMFGEYLYLDDCQYASHNENSS